MKKSILISALVLGGCTPIFLNEPNLASPPSDMAKYHVDLQACEDEQKPTSAETLTGGMGALPVTVIMLTEGRDFTSFKSGYTLRDECMVRKGYVLKD